jgi:cytochrome c biogenesis protein CcdA
MIETITPAGCGGRRRRRIALALFAVAATASATVVGLVLGALGDVLGARRALLAVAALAALAAARELGVVRLPLPQVRAQVPDRWRSELPLPVWAAGYGAGLGAGFFTYQPFATFWIACLGAAALARPGVSAACFALFGAGRALMVALPGRDAEPARAVERLVRRRPLLARVNAFVLAVAALALALAPAAGAQLFGGGQLDPSFSGGVLAYTQRDAAVSSVVVRQADGTQHVFEGRTPALDGSVLAYTAADGVHVVRWPARQEISLVAGATKPALEWPWLAYRLDAFDGSKELWLTNLTTGAATLVTRAGAHADLGRPSIAAGRVAWHVVGERGSLIGLYTIESGARRVLVRSKIALLSNPSLTASRIVWVDQRQARSALRGRRLDDPRVTTLAAARTRAEAFWTTELEGRSAYVTHWFVLEDFAQLERYPF